jgi:hypothetical protein
MADPLPLTLLENFAAAPFEESAPSTFSRRCTNTHHWPHRTRAHENARGADDVSSSTNDENNADGRQPTE